MGFEIGQTALDVCKTIVESQPMITQVFLLEHEVEVNWRQKYASPKDKAAKLIESFEHTPPLSTKCYARSQFLKAVLPPLPSNHVWSMKSQVITTAGPRHIPMMNFHPEGVGLETIEEALRYIVGDERGVLLESGRHHHYYGNFLFDNEGWRKFVAEFLMPTVLVSPRYAGHRLFEGYCTLRLTADATYKPKVPSVVSIF